MNSFQKQIGLELLIAGGALVAVIALTQIVAGHLAGNARKILQQKSDLALRISATGQLASLKADSDKAQPLFTILNSILPPKDDLINFGQSLTQLARTERIDLGFTFGAETPAKGNLPGFIPFSLTGTGTYENFQKFLRDVEKSRYIVKFNSVDLVRQGENSTFGIIAEGQVFYQ